jgi:radical SAM superfamily enzyme YgiQ (UPF0313 family)
MSDIVLLNPRFDVTFLGLEHALPLLHKKATMPVPSLPLLAALTPADDRVTIVDENVEPIDYARLARADLVGLTGMIVQRRRMREILAEVKKLNVFTVVGGPWVTVQEDYFGQLPDAVFIGEAEETWPRFLEEWKRGTPRKRYQQAGHTDMARVPAPRLELLKTQHYLFGSIQFSRGCPFQCDFCDSVVIFGHRPRFKTAEQILVEIDALHAHRLEVVFIVDDNLVGNRAAIKELLGPVIAWQEKHGYPIIFVAEASLDLAEDSELMDLMLAANIQSVFVGVESSSVESLRSARKYQNISRHRTLAERVRAIQSSGLEAWCGMVVGFDQDASTVFEAQRDFVRQAHIVEVMVSMLSAIPKTPLYSRLAAEGRLDPDDEPVYGTNVIPLKMSRDQLRDGYIWLMNELYSPANYFARLDSLLLDDHLQLARQQALYWRHHPWAGARAKSRLFLRAFFLFALLMLGVPDAALRREYRRHILGILHARPDPAIVFGYVLKCAMHYHHYRMARDMAGDRSRVLNPY